MRGAGRRGPRWAALLLACALLAAGAAAAAAQEAAREAYTITGSDFQYRREGDVRVSTLIDARLESDSLVITANRAERHENEVRREDEIFLYGDVVAVEGRTRIAGKQGHYDRWRQVATVTGAVRILDGETEIRCDEAVYERRTQRIVLRGDVDIEQPGSRIRARRIHYMRDTGFAEAWASVAVHDLDGGTVLRGEHGTWDRQRSLAVMDDAPTLVHVPAAGDTVRVRARLMSQRRADSLAVAVGDVRYRRGETTAYCDSAVFLQARDRLLLFGKPRVLRRGGELSGDAMQLRFTAGELVGMHVDGAARFLDEPADPRAFAGLRSEIAGERFRIVFADGDISLVEVQGQPRSFYIPPLGDAGRASLNEASGDSMALRFAEGEISEVRIFGDAEGRYRYVDDWPVRLGAAGPVPADSAAAGGAAAADSAAAGDAVADSAAAGARFMSRAQEIRYRARDILYRSDDERVYLEGEAEVESEDFTLEARAIRFDSRQDFLDARGEPVLVDKNDRLYGRLMEYDIDRKEGLVHDGTTRYGEGFYSGERLKRTESDRLYVTDSHYTTCEYAPPHYHFQVDRMMVKIGDKVVGAPVRFYLGEVPLFYLPFMFSNLERGRRSGFLQPDFEFGITLNRDKPQRFVRDIGYYWALSEYADLSVRGDFIERRSLYGSLNYRYYRRYFLGGSVRSNLSYDVSRDLRTDTFSWGLRGTHVQEIGERTRLNATVDFVSSEQLREIDHYTVEETVNQRLTSNVGLSRTWDNVSLNASYRRTQILNQEDDDPATDNLLRDESLPVSLSTTSIPLWPGGERHGGLRGALARLKLKPSIRYSRAVKTYETRRTTSESASTGTSLGFNWMLGFVNVRPSVSFSDNWSRSDVGTVVTRQVPFGPGDGPATGAPTSPAGEILPLAETQVTVTEDGTHSLQWSSSATATTKFYGLFYPRLGSLSGLRHTITPSVSWRYSESRGRTFSLSRHLGFSLDNTLDLKFGEGEQVTRKTGLLKWSLSTGYDLNKTREQLPWDDLSSTVRFSPIANLSFQLGHRWDVDRGEQLSTTLSGSLNLSGQFRYGRVEEEERRRNVVSERESGLATAAADSAGTEEDEAFDPLAPLADAPRQGSRMGDAQSWRLGFSFSLNRTQASQPSPTVALGGSVQLTRNWKLEYRTNLRLADGELGSQTLNVTRDLHCFEATFSRLVFQGQEQYYFRIFLKAHPEDIKVESGDRGVGYGY
ncbi:MAG: hypothetical protein JW819_03300 [Candidatus Krumholzibacteriota bacterium]|nr:hypothetical protein [Candidatus Krumholzibacteriota bacterium]